MIDFIVEIVIKPFFTEKLRVLKYYSQKKTAQRRLLSTSSKKMKKGLSLLFELADSYPLRIQEIINEIAEFLRKSFPQGILIKQQQKETLELGIRSLTALPRLDQNGFPYNIDIHQIRIEDINLTRTNFKFFSLWGCQFFNVVFSHSSFEEADLGGSIFDSCSLEYADKKNAKMCGSFMDEGRPTRFRGTRLWGTNLTEADVEFCELHNIEDVDFKEVQQLIDEGKLKIV